MGIEKTGKRFSVLRHALSYSVEEKALVVGCSPSAVRAYEDGRRPDTAYPSAVLIDVVDDVAPPGNWTEATDPELVGRLITNIRGYVRAVDEVQEKSTGRTIAYLMSTQAQRVAYGGGGYRVGAAGASSGTGTARGLWLGGGAF